MIIDPFWAKAAVAFLILAFVIGAFVGAVCRYAVEEEWENILDFPINWPGVIASSFWGGVESAAMASSIPAVGYGISFVFS